MWPRWIAGLAGLSGAQDGNRAGRARRQLCGARKAATAQGAQDGNRAGQASNTATIACASPWPHLCGTEASKLVRPRCACSGLHARQCDLDAHAGRLARE